MKLREEYIALPARFFLFITAFISIFPFSVRFPGGGLDPSWVLGMAEAVSKGMDIGKDVIFTFGPYSYVYTKLYTPDTALAMYGACFFLATTFGAMLLRCLSGASNKSILIFSLVLAATSLSRDAVFFVFIFSVGLVIAENLKAALERKEEKQQDTLLIAIGLVTLSLLPLVKGTLLILSFGVWGMAMILAITQKSKWTSLLFFVLPPISVVLFWISSGQDLRYLDDYFLNIIPIISGYSEAMAKDGPLEEVLLFLILASAVFYLFIKNFSKSLWVTLFVLVYAVSFLMITMKAGLVRHDGHAIISFSFIVIASFLVAISLGSKKSWSVAVVCFVCAYGVFGSYGRLGFVDIDKRVYDYYASVKIGVSKYLDSDYFDKRYNAAMEKISSEFSFSGISGTVDTYPWDQSNLIASGLDWNPRPVFQSYSAYTKELVQKNVSHLRSESGPDSIIFSVKSIDGRHPMQDDGVSRVEILKNYKAIGFESESILFGERDKEYKEFVDFSEVVQSGTAAVGSNVVLPDSEGYYFLKMNIKKNFLGAISSVLFKPSTVQLVVNGDDGWRKSYRIVSGSVSAGFLLSPNLESTERLALGVVNEKSLGDYKVESFSIVVDGWEALWNHQYEYEVYKLDLSLGDDHELSYKELGMASLASTSKYEQNPQRVSSDASCVGSIDNADKGGRYVSASGWMGVRSNKGITPIEKLVLAVESESEVKFVVPTRKVDRVDVANHFDNPEMKKSGFQIKVVSGEASPRYEYTFGYYKNKVLFLCSRYSI